MIYIWLIFNLFVSSLAFFLQRVPVKENSNGTKICQNLKYDKDTNELIKKTSNLNCVNKSVLKIKKAFLYESSPTTCPLHYVHSEINQFKTCPDPTKGIEVTQTLRKLCQNKESCDFDFADLPKPECKLFNKDIDMGVYFPVENLLYLNVSYGCLLPRLKYWPFSNKKFDMNKYFLVFLFNLNYLFTHGTMIVPSILDDSKPVIKSICMDPTLERNNNQPDQEIQPYLNCVNQAILKISSASLMTSNSTICPNQFPNNLRGPSCSSKNFGNSDVTNLFKILCHSKEKCNFEFDQLPNLLCIDNKNDVYEVPNEFTYIKVKYKCQTPRRRYRPFSNKRFDPKFKPRVNSQIRKLSFNNLNKLG
ncbi:unnamed protein product [Brachionus calyciflorus]|uniref:SUEL-type lectin domain-containing protein n=1 Tax=Brachionus calyciflorus TaxID=104777 RepID=A0A814KD04_9BILA|nr:unnamed protein product [Brachionus calyciflorus]